MSDARTLFPTESDHVDNFSNRWTLRHIFRMRGSVFPRSFLIALPSVVLVCTCRFLIDQFGVEIGELQGSQLWAGYNTCLGFLVIFRTQKAYTRWWEGGSLLQKVRGEWWSAASSLVAFCTADPAKQDEVRDFQHLMVRVMSLMYCSALQQVAMLSDDCFEILDTKGMDKSSLAYLMKSGNRCEVIMSWMNRIIVNNINSGVLSVPHPVITRVFQELGLGFVNHNNVRKIREFAFPFPYAQIITFMLLAHWFITPIASCLLIDNTAWACVLSFIAVFAFWSINYIAEEIEMPFGEDPNDLPIVRMQHEMNESLHRLLEEGSRTPPTFNYEQSLHQKTSISLAEDEYGDVGATKFSSAMSTAWPTGDLTKLLRLLRAKTGVTGDCQHGGNNLQPTESSRSPDGSVACDNSPISEQEVVREPSSQPEAKQHIHLAGSECERRESTSDGEPSPCQVESVMNFPVSSAPGYAGRSVTTPHRQRGPVARTLGADAPPTCSAQSEHRTFQLTLASA